MSDPEQLGGEPAVDRRDLVGLEAGRRDDLRRLLVADRERHVRAHHKAVRAEHRDDELQHPRVVQDAVEIELGERFDRIGHARRDLLIALEPADQERQAGRAHGDDDPGVAVAHDVAAVDEPRHRDHGIADAADRIGQAIVVHPHVAGIEARMDVDGGAGLVRRPPERIEVGASSTLPMPRGSVADHGAREARRHRRLSTAAARAPSCSGTVASGTSRGSALAAASIASLASRLHASPSAGGNS